MRFRLGMVVGFGAGYYLGAKAGQDRYRQLQDIVQKAKHSEAFETVTEKAKEVVDAGVGKARDLVDGHTADGGSPAPLDLLDDVGPIDLQDMAPVTPPPRRPL